MSDLDRKRVTVSVHPQVLEIFKTMAEASGLSVSRCMGEWLADTADGAMVVAAKMREARSAPVRVMQEMQAAMHGLQGEVATVLDGIRAAARAGGAAAAGRAPPAVRAAPSSNTGLKVPRASRVVGPSSNKKGAKGRGKS